MFDFLWTLLLYKVLVFLLVLLVLVFVHEMGHYLVARLFGVRILTFSIGFGPEIGGWTDRKGTRWKLCWLPLGGYVRMFGDLNAASMVDPQISGLPEKERNQAFPFKSLPQRAAIIVAGPLANFLFGLLILASHYAFAGIQVTPPVVGYVIPGSAAEKAEIEIGDRILGMNGLEIEQFEDIIQAGNLERGEQIEFNLLRDHREVAVTAAFEAVPRFNDLCQKIGYGDPGFRAPWGTELNFVGEGSAGAKAGLLAGDKITHVQGKVVRHFEEIRQILRSSPGKTIDIGYERKDGRGETKATLEKREVCDKDGNKIQIGLLGVWATPSFSVRSLDPLEAFAVSLKKIYTFVGSTLQALKQMISGERGVEDLGGPIGIANVVGSAAQSGFSDLIMITAILSLNLGLINLFPIPVLDGGHLVLYAIEAVRRKPLSEKGQEIIFKAGFMLIMTLMIFLFWNDIAHLSGR